MNIDQVVELTGISARTVRRKVKSGELSSYNNKTGKKALYRKEDIMRIAAQTINNKEKFRPDHEANPNNLDIPRIKVVTTKEEVDRAIKDDPNQDLLNDTGTSVLNATTKYLEGKGLLDTCSPDAIYGYAIACQMKEKYLIVADMIEEKWAHDLAKMYQAEIQYFQKELGLTPASLAKIKPQEEKPKAFIDPMEDLI